MCCPVYLTHMFTMWGLIFDYYFQGVAFRMRICKQNILIVYWIDMHSSASEVLSVYSCEF